jgi:hypothetical protein
MPRARRRTGKGSQTASTGCDTRAEPAPGSRSDSKQDRDLVMIDPWSMLLEQLLEPAVDDGDDERGDTRGREIGA